MSYDLSLWTVECVPATAIQKLMPDSKISNGEVELVGNGWLAAIGHSTKAEPEDIPDQIAAELPGIGWLICVNIQPISAPDAAKDEIKAALTILAKEFRGVVEDQQIGTVVLPSGSEQHSRAVKDIASRVVTLNLNYWFTESPLRTRQGRELLIDYVAKHLPEALPRRYGLYEPPNEKWEIGGKKAFLDFLDRQVPDSTVVIYTSRPCVGFNISPRSVGWIRRGPNPTFGCGCLQLAFEFTALEDDDWRTAIEKAWLDIARITEPFATNVEVLDDWIIRRGRLWIDGRTEASVCSPAWFGIPRKLGLAFGLAEQYVAYWPKFKSHAVSADGVSYVDARDWQSRRSVSDIVGEAPWSVRERPGRGRVVSRGGRRTSYKPAPKGYPWVFFFPRPWRTRLGL
ncbi:MAG: hypothetical protein WA837_04835 [Xanthobacteraceae bacterium]